MPWGISESAYNATDRYAWPEYRIVWRLGETRYDISVSNPERRSRGVKAATLDGAAVDHRAIPLVADGRVHDVSLVLGTA